MTTLLHTHTRTHAVTPADHSYTSEGSGLDHPRIVLATTATTTTTIATTAAAAADAATTATGFCWPSLETGRRITGAYCRPLRSALLGYVESRDATSQLVPCNCAPIVSIVHTLRKPSFHVT